MIRRVKGMAPARHGIINFSFLCFCLPARWLFHPSEFDCVSSTEGVGSRE